MTFRGKKSINVRLLLSEQTKEQQRNAEREHDELEQQISKLEVNTEYRLDLNPNTLESLGEVGAGAGGTVIKARHLTSGIIMARKMIPLQADDQLKRLIVRELQLLHDCCSPHIVSFYGAFSHEGTISMCMEFMDLGSFDSIYRKIGRLPSDILGRVATSVLDGLEYLHKTHKIMHRDIKPSNILLNSKGEIKICDFGVSGHLTMSKAKSFVGTSWYMAPERIQGGEHYGVQSDSWSLGLSLMEMALGAFPFKRNMPIFELIVFIVKEPAPRIPDNADVTKEFREFIEACLIKDDSKRPTPSALLQHPYIVASRAAKVDMDSFVDRIKALD